MGIGRTVLIAILLGVLAGCAKPRISIGVTSYLSHDLPFPAVSGDALVSVSVASQPDQPMLEAEIKRKVEFLLTERGYRIGDARDCKYWVYLMVSVDDGRTETGATPVREGGGTSFTQVRTSSGQWATATTHHPSRTNYVPYSVTVYSRFLGIDLFDRERWIAAAEDSKHEATIWRGEVLSPGTSSDLRGVADYLLIAGFDQLGKDTGKRLECWVDTDDKRVAAFRDAFGSKQSKPSVP